MNAEMDISKNQWRSTGGLTACPLLHGNKKKETDTEKILIYYNFRRFCDCSKKKPLSLKANIIL